MPKKTAPKPKAKAKKVLKTKTKAAAAKPKPKTAASAKAKPTAAPKPRAAAAAKTKAAAGAKDEAKRKAALKEKVREMLKRKFKPQARPAESTEDETSRKERLRRLLILRREDIIREAKSEIKKFKSGERKQLVETVMDDGDMSVVDLSEDISLKQLSTHRETLMKIDMALRKLEEGTYGICEECGDEISEERLKIMPFAIYCRDDQEKKELIESMSREGD